MNIDDKLRHAFESLTDDFCFPKPKAGWPGEVFPLPVHTSIDDYPEPPGEVFVSSGRECWNTTCRSYSNLPIKDPGKPTNPKDAVGIKKSPLSVLSGVVLMEMALGNMEGALKYGRHNWRAAGIRASVYYDATMRHLMQWWEGEDIDAPSGLSHVTKAICSLMVLRDAMIHDMVTDDRPPKSPAGWMQELNDKASGLVEQFPDPLPAITEKRDE